MRYVKTIMVLFCIISLQAELVHARSYPNSRFQSAPTSFADTVDKLMPAVVNISTTQKVRGRAIMPEFFFPEMNPDNPLEGFREFFDRFKELQPHRGEGGGEDGSDGTVERKAYSLGSGFVIDPSGYIVTNNHVIAEAEEITVRFSDETELQADIIGRDTKTDLALLKVETKKKLPYVRFGDSEKSRVGDWIIAIGNPFGLGGTVTAGIISARARDINAGPFDNFIQTDAAINSGNSGGPMFNMDGKVIGINTAIFSPSGGNVGIGFAMPSSMARPVIEQLKKTGRMRWGWLGVKIQTVSDDIAESLGLDQPRGALVVEITEGSPARASGLQPGDVILEFDGQKVKEMRGFPRLVAQTPVGKTVTLIVWRDGKRVGLRTTLGEFQESDVAESNEPLTSPSKRMPEKAETYLGMELLPVTPATRQTYDIDDSIQGLFVRRVDGDSTAAKRGVRRFDVLMRINEAKLSDVGALKLELEKAKKQGRKFALLRISRDGDTHFVTLPTE
jgi:serine protease Do